MEFSTYILKCSDGSFYTGHTDNLELRIAQHHSGYFPDCYTFKKRPLELAYQAHFESREQALAAEMQIKGWSRRKKIALINNDFDALKNFSRKRT